MRAYFRAVSMRNFVLRRRWRPNESFCNQPVRGHLGTPVSAFLLKRVYHVACARYAAAQLET